MLPALLPTLLPTKLHPLRLSLLLITLGLLSTPSSAEDQAQPKPNPIEQTLQPLAPGLTLPIELSHGLKAGHTKPGSTVTPSTRPHPATRQPQGNPRTSPPFPPK